MFRRLRNAWGLVIAAIVLVGCGAAVAFDSDQEVNKHTGKQNEVYFKNQPLDLYDYSALRDVKQQIDRATIPELRASWHVFVTPGMGATDSCAGMGSALPYSAQLTSPEYADEHGQYDDGTVTLPQNEPSGLYIPDDTSATWVLCDYGNGLEPVYVEDSVRTYFHKVSVRDGVVIHENSGPPSVVINPSRDK